MSPIDRSGMEYDIYFNLTSNILIIENESTHEIAVDRIINFHLDENTAYRLSPVNTISIEDADGLSVISFEYFNSSTENPINSSVINFELDDASIDVSSAEIMLRTNWLVLFRSPGMEDITHEGMGDTFDFRVEQHTDSNLLSLNGSFGCFFDVTDVFHLVDYVPFIETGLILAGTLIIVSGLSIHHRKRNHYVDSN